MADPPAIPVVDLIRAWLPEGDLEPPVEELVLWWAHSDLSGSKVRWTSDETFLLLPDEVFEVFVLLEGATDSGGTPLQTYREARDRAEAAESSLKELERASRNYSSLGEICRDLRAGDVGKARHHVDRLGWDSPAWLFNSGLINAALAAADAVSIPNLPVCRLPREGLGFSKRGDLVAKAVLGTFSTTASTKAQLTRATKLLLEPATNQCLPRAVNDALSPVLTDS